MALRLVYDRVHPVSGDVLWEHLENVLTAMDGVTLIRMETDRKRAILQTDATWTSWGQNMIATVEPVTPSRASLKVSGQVRHTLLSSGWGERLHARWFTQELERALADLCHRIRSSTDPED